MKSQHCLIAVAAAVLALPVPGAAHHSFAAEFDVNQPITLKGTVNKMDWVNPHTWLYVDVKNQDGTVTTWRFEIGPPNTLLRMGWRKNSIATGTEVEIQGFRAKDGDNVGNGKSVKLPDGRELFSGGSAPGAQGAEGSEPNQKK